VRQSRPGPSSMVRSSAILNSRLLVVQDAAGAALPLEGMLSSAGYASVESVNDPREVCELHRLNRYDLIVVDLGMPGIFGHHVLEGLAQIEKGPLPVLAIAAQAGDEGRALRAGVRATLTAPIDRAGVLRRVRDTIRTQLSGTATRDLQAREAERQWAAESFRRMVESIVDCAIVQLDLQGRVLSWNAGAEQLLGWSAAEILGQRFSAQHELDLAGKGRFATEGWRARKDGSRLWASVVYTPVRDAAGNLRGFALLALPAYANALNSAAA
jgi:PAS domain S-box-containing protein